MTIILVPTDEVTHIVDNKPAAFPLYQMLFSE